MTDAADPPGRRRSAAGGFVEPFAPPRPDTSPPHATLRGLQREWRHLELRRIEIAVELAGFDRRIGDIAIEAPVRIQGPVEATRFAQAVRGAARLRIAACATDQRLRRLRLDIAIATGAVARALRPR